MLKNVMPKEATQTGAGITTFYLWYWFYQKHWCIRFRNWLGAFRKKLLKRWIVEKYSHADIAHKNVSAAYLNVLELLCLVLQLQSLSNILRMVGRGEIPYHEQDGLYLFKRSEIDGWMELNQSESATDSSFINPQVYSK